MAVAPGPEGDILPSPAMRSRMLACLEADVKDWRLLGKEGKGVFFSSPLPPPGAAGRLPEGGGELTPAAYSDEALSCSGVGVIEVGGGVAGT